MYMVSGLDMYKTADYGKLFQYFFKLYGIAFTIGIATDDFEVSRNDFPKISIDKDDEVRNFVVVCVSYLQGAYPPIVIDILMDHLYLECLNATTSVEQRTMMALARRLIKGIHQFNIEIILDTKRLWSDDTVNYAEKNFYPRLPNDIKEKYFL